MLSREQRAVRRLFKLLKHAKRSPFPGHGKGVAAPNDQGVYLIYAPRSGFVVHVGRTYRGKAGLRQRLNNHLHGSSSFVQEYLKGHGKRLRSGYSFRYLAVRSSRQRALLEAYAAGVLCPRHIGLSKLKDG